MEWQTEMAERIDQDWLNKPSLQELLRLLNKGEGEARIAGGAVRNALLEQPISDVDVATNLKWGMASNMLVMSPALEFETWFMEGALEPGKHFVLLENDFSDLEDKVAYYTEHTEEAEAIIANAHAWVAQFGDPLKERMVSARILEKYFELSGQM